MVACLYDFLRLFIFARPRVENRAWLVSHATCGKVLVSDVMLFMMFPSSAIDAYETNSLSLIVYRYTVFYLIVGSKKMITIRAMFPPVKYIVGRDPSYSWESSVNDKEKTGWINASRKYFSICIKMMLTILLDSCPHTPLSEACSVTWDFFWLTLGGCLIFACTKWLMVNFREIG